MVLETLKLVQLLFITITTSVLNLKKKKNSCFSSTSENELNMKMFYINLLHVIFMEILSQIHIMCGTKTTFPPLKATVPLQSGHVPHRNRTHDRNGSGFMTHGLTTCATQRT